MRTYRIEKPRCEDGAVILAPVGTVQARDLKAAALATAQFGLNVRIFHQPKLKPEQPEEGGRA